MVASVVELYAVMAGNKHLYDVDRRERIFFPAKGKKALHLKMINSVSCYFCKTELETIPFVNIKML